MNKILYIDDDNKLCEVAKSILSIFDYEVNVVNSIEKLEGINWQEYKLIIIDWFFTESGAMSIYEKAMDAGYQQRVMIASSRELGNSQRLIFDQKGITYLSKPFSCISLSAGVEGALK